MHDNRAKQIAAVVVIVNVISLLKYTRCSEESDQNSANRIGTLY